MLRLQGCLSPHEVLSGGFCTSVPFSLQAGKYKEAFGGEKIVASESQIDGGNVAFRS